MTATRITNTTSRFASNGPAFGSMATDHSASADSLIIDDGAYLVTTDGSSNVVELDATGAWSVTVNGSISAGGGDGINLQAGNAAKSTITINATGELGGSIYARSSATISNAGLIFGKIFLKGGLSYTVNNSGTIKPANGDNNHNYGIDNTTAGSTTTLTNSGTIARPTKLSDGSDTVTNTGTMGGITFGAGNNTYKALVATASTPGITANDGNDTIISYGAVGILYLGNGNNTITLSATASATSSITQDVISLGNGNDTIYAHGLIDGPVAMGDGTNSFTQAVTGSAKAIRGGSGNDTISIGGKVEGEIVLGEGVNSLSVSGRYDGGTTGVTGGLQNDKVDNSGIFTGPVALGGGINTLTNSGLFTGSVTGRSLVFDNKKSFSGSVVFDTSSGNKFFNTFGIFTGSVTSGTVDFYFNNSGKFTGSIVIAGGNNTFINSGSIGDPNPVRLGSNNDTVTNTATGFIHGIDLGNGINTVTNDGTIGYVGGGENADTVTNRGRITSVTDLDDGDDFYTGGSYVDIFQDGAGKDTVKLGAGNDIYYAVPYASPAHDGVDSIDGGLGIDTYIADRVSGGAGEGGFGNEDHIYINIDTIFHHETTVSTIGVNANSANGAGGEDKLSGFENVTGRFGDDVIYGNGLVNVLKGEDGSDGLFGFAGNDRLEGGNGVDNLVGGLGVDKLYGGGADGAADQFIYLDVKESGPLKAARDIIFDFEDGKDKINVSVIDANTKNMITGSSDAFHFLGVNVAFAANDPGGLRVVQSASGWTVEGDVNGDAKADIAIDVVDPMHSIVFTLADFVL